MRELRCNKYTIEIPYPNAYNYNKATHTLQNLFDCIKSIHLTLKNENLNLVTIYTQFLFYVCLSHKNVCIIIWIIIKLTYI